MRTVPGVFLATVVAVVSHDAVAQSGGLPVEIQTRDAADTRLQTNIDAEAAARSSADAALDARISAETAARNQAIEELRRSIGSGGGGGAGGGTVNVDCGAGGSVSQALASGATRIVVRGACTESVTIDRDDVTLLADPAGGSIHGPDSNISTVVVRGNRVTVEGLIVSGGRNGISAAGASNLSIRNATVHSAGRSGIAYAFGSSGTVDGCIVQANGRDGIVVDSAYARITNCTITGNTRNGILIVNNGNGQIGLTERLEAAGNTVQRNGAAGISVSGGSYATAAMNQITGNASFGISVFQAGASISGGNSITDNAGVGVSANGAKVVLGDAGPGLSTVNTIMRNGNQATGGGVIGFLGTTLLVRDAQISNNNGAGLLLSLRSQGQIMSTTIQNNASDGVRLLLGSTLFPSASPSNAATTVSGNAGAGIQCFDGESSVVNTNVTTPPIMTVSGNAMGDVAAACTAF
jgi:hypothetical protein